MGGKNSKHFKEFERARIKQESIVGKQQALFYMLAKESEVFASLGAAVANIEAHDTTDPSSVTLERSLFEHLQDAAAFSESVLHALSDSVHILGAELSELERQKDDCVDCLLGNSVEAAIPVVQTGGGSGNVVAAPLRLTA